MPLVELVLSPQVPAAQVPLPLGLALALGLERQPLGRVAAALGLGAPPLGLRALALALRRQPLLLLAQPLALPLRLQVPTAGTMTTLPTHSQRSHQGASTAINRFFKIFKNKLADTISSPYILTICICQ